jgi:hypothetical protein
MKDQERRKRRIEAMRPEVAQALKTVYEYTQLTCEAACAEESSYNHVVSDTSGNSPENRLREIQCEMIALFNIRNNYRGPHIGQRSREMDFRAAAFRKALSRL